MLLNQNKISEVLDVEKAEWREYKTLNTWYFCIPFKKMSVHVYAAMIKIKNDGRFEWFKKISWPLLNREGKIQGVCATLEEAKFKALEDLYENC